MRHEDVTQRIIDSAMKVHTALGAGMLESTYHACLHYEFSVNGLHFEHQVRLPVVYHGVKLSTAYRVDFVVENCLVIEIKCVEKVLPVHKAQLRAAHVSTG